MKKTGSVYRVALCGLLTAMMLVLGYIENLIPIPIGIPGVKLGLSNSVLLFALYLMDIPTAIVLMVLKVGLSGLLFGGVQAMAFALAGGVLSLLAMILMRRIKGIGLITVSIVGAVMHNVGQVFMAFLILQTKGLLYYLAVLVLVAVLTGALTGVVAGSVIKHVKKLKLRR